MKKILVLLYVFGFAFSSCEKDEKVQISPESCEDTMECVDSCLFTRFNQIGKVSFVPCYDTWGIYYKEDPSQEYDDLTLILDMPEDYKVEEKEVVFSATFFDNDIPFLFPDPPGPARYKSELCEIQIQD